MMINLGVILFTLFVFGVALNNWFRGLCLMLVMLAVLERPDMPREVLGITGLNPFNIMLLGILAGWMLQKGKESLSWPVPATINRLWIAYGVICVIAFVRMMLSYSELIVFHTGRGGSPPSQASLFRDYFLNTIKWILPGLLMCYGANTIQRRNWAIASIMATSLLLGLQILSRMAPALIGSDDLADRALRVLDRNIGYHRVDLAAIMGSASWAFFSLRIAAKNPFLSQLLFLLFLLTTLAMVATGGRAGYAAWAACGAFLCMLRWRKWLLVAPFAVVFMIATVPGVSERITQGFSEETYSNYAAQGKGTLDTVDESGRDLYSITSGRVILWPVVFGHILDAPLFGHGMHGFWKLRINESVKDEIGFDYNVGHSHNAYLELALDTGFIAFTIIGLFYAAVVLRAMAVFTSHHYSPQKTAIAGMTLSFIVVQLIACLGSQSFYPAQGTVLMWCCIGLFFSTGGSDRYAYGEDETKSRFGDEYANFSVSRET